jgi:hypothetical protein
MGIGVVTPHSLTDLYQSFGAPVILDVFTILLFSTGHGADHIDNKPRDSYLASPLTLWLLPSKEI